ncbi:hypothetical protein F2Q68_00009074 [Brassica cretica]|uniref:Uncharacterized protein n=1 Tax=Brassica cretica TaxID=69181 RepID=A0A8S9KXM3_BRACR|nr:hypothetical protein F2Q68_00009074 [Brassica cretica]
MSSEVYYRSWMDKPHLDPNTNLLTEEYVQGIGEFMRLVQQQPDAKSGFRSWAKEQKTIEAHKTSRALPLPWTTTLVVMATPCGDGLQPNRSFIKGLRFFHSVSHLEEILTQLLRNSIL